MVIDHHVNGRSLRLQTATTTRLSSGWSWRMAQVVPPHYLNDIFIYSKTKEEHIKYVTVVLKILKKVDIRINSAKNIFHV
jgi:hypothetical protein